MPLSSLPQSELDHPVAVLSRDGAWLAAADTGARHQPVVAVWDTLTGNRLQELTAGLVRALAFSPDKRLLAAGDSRGRVRIWSLPDRKRVAGFSATLLPIHCLAFRPDGQRLAVGAAGGVLRIWDWAKGRQVCSCLGSEWNVYTVAFSPDGTLLASGGRNSSRLWDAASGRLLLGLPGLDFTSGLAFSADGTFLAATSVSVFAPGAVEVWKLEYGRGIRTLRGLTGLVDLVRFSPDQRLLAALAQNWEVAVWDLSTGQLRRHLPVRPGLGSDNAGLAISPDGTQVAFSAGTRAGRWDIATGCRLNSWKLPPGLGDGLAFDRSGTKLLLFRIETTTGQPPYGNDATKHPRVGRVRNLLGPKPDRWLWQRPFALGVARTLVPPDGSFFVLEARTGRSSRQYLYLTLEGATGKERWRCVARERAPRLTFSGKTLIFPPDLLQMPDGKKIGSVGPGVIQDGRPQGYWACPTEGEIGSNRVSLFRQYPRRSLATLEVECHARCVTFGRGGRLLACAGADGTVRVYDLVAIHQQLAAVGLGW
jgi:WD40 repeat protein